MKNLVLFLLLSVVSFSEVLAAPCGTGGTPEGNSSNSSSNSNDSSKNSSSEK